MAMLERCMTSLILMMSQNSVLYISNLTLGNACVLNWIVILKISVHITFYFINLFVLNVQDFIYMLLVSNFFKESYVIICFII